MDKDGFLAPVVDNKAAVLSMEIQKDGIQEAQQKLVDAVYAVNPYAINDLQKKVPAILLSAFGNQKLGTGIANVLTGKSSVAGVLI